MDTTTFLIIIVVLIALILLAVGIYVILVLHEARQSLQRANRILDRVDSITEIIDSKLVRPATTISGVFSVAKDLLTIIREFTKKEKAVAEKNGEQ